MPTTTKSISRPAPERDRPMTTKIIGKVTAHIGDEHPHLAGRTVRIVAVSIGAVRLQQPEEGLHIGDEEDLIEAGGVTADDRVKVQRRLEAEGRYSFVTSDPRAVDLECLQQVVSTLRGKR